jgi:hypothetical protein
MTQQDKELLLKDLSARLNYKPMCHAGEINLDGELFFINVIYNIVALTSDKAVGKFETCPIVDVKPYLRPMSSMTKEEAKEASKISRTKYLEHIAGWYKWGCVNEVFVDWLNAHHFDYRGLIEKGLALETPEGMYKNE